AGLTYTEIRKALQLDIPNSTLNNWVRDIRLTPTQRARIQAKERDSLRRSQPLAAVQNQEQKRRRLRAIAEKAAPIVDRLAENDEALMLMASALYMGEGAKSEKHFSLGNSDPRIIQAWLAILRGTLGIVESNVYCLLPFARGSTLS
ncbi:MAG TPA: hypothetical protein VJ754_00525, partial [Anaerolineae bacterium]|nr:hypothetical protein [Anaerolineae bacterium]